MIPFVFDYATPSAFHADRTHAQLGLAADWRRPVRFHARVKDQVLTLRLALQALGEVIWSNEMWLSSGEYAATVLDPIITVHPDRVFFEAFSQDQSVYALVVADRDLFAPEGEVRCGTTNVDFTVWLWAALGEMRSSRETWLRIEAEGLAVETHWAGGRFERKVDVPDPWVRGFLQLQGAMALPGTRVIARPVDLLAALRFLQYTRAKISPRALRYEFEPGQPVRLVLEPWEEVIPLRETEHHYEELHVIRTWGRRRLRLLEPLLPYAESVAVYLKGRALPSFYAVRLQGITFLLGLSGWSEKKWTDAGSFDLLTDDARVDESLVAQALDRLREQHVLGVDDLAGSLGSDRATAAQVFARLCRQGRAMYDVERRQYRHRELFATPVDEERLFPPDPRRERARDLLAADRVQVHACQPRERRKTVHLPSPEGRIRKEIIHREWEVTGAAGEQAAVTVVMDDTGRIIFGTCGCAFFRDHLLNQGPCEHLIALHRASAPQRGDLPTSRAAPEPATPAEPATDFDKPDAGG